MLSLIYYMFGCPKCYVGLCWIDHPAHCHLMFVAGFWGTFEHHHHWVGSAHPKMGCINTTMDRPGQGQAPSPPQTHSQQLLWFGGKGLEVKLLDELSRRASFTYSLEVKDWSGLVENRRSMFMNSCFLHTCSFLNSWSACSHEPGRPIFSLVHKHMKLFFWIKLCMYAVLLCYVLIRFTFKFQDASVSKLPSVFKLRQCIWLGHKVVWDDRPAPCLLSLDKRNKASWKGDMWG